MQALQRTSLLIIAVLAAVTACVMPQVTFTDPILEATLQALTVEAAVRGTQQAAGTGAASASPGPSPTASLIPSPTSSPVPSETPTPSLTPTPIASVTPLVPMISVSVATNCRTGPGKPYRIVGALLVGQVAQVYARDPTGHYWYIQNPGSPGEYCYVWDGYATFYGYTGALPMYTPPPTPTPTFTPTPVPGFDATYNGLVHCASNWWVQIAVKNTGQIPFRSLRFNLRDLKLDKAVSLESDDFVNKPNCSSSTSKVSLEAGKTLVISSPELDYDPSGHNMRARITLCSKQGQEGTCVTTTVTFKP